jgi:hypothetical protein
LEAHQGVTGSGGAFPIWRLFLRVGSLATLG